MTLLSFTLSAFQAKKKYFDTELENLERQQKQQVEKMEQDHAVRRREEAKRIRLEQERDYGRFQEQLRLMKKEVRAGRGRGSGRPGTLSVASDRDPSSASPWQQNLGISLTWEAHVRCLICLLPPHQEEPLPCRLGSAFLCRLPGRPSPVVWAASYTSFSLAAPAERHWGSRMVARGM